VHGDVDETREVCGWGVGGGGRGSGVCVTMQASVRP
jgi:hypothetical protein